MANKYFDSALLDKAITFAVKAHANTERRGKGFPYIVHPMEAMEIVATITRDQELLAAAALHDVVEDTDVTVDELRKEFGERIAKLVEAESDKFDPNVSEHDSWHQRKQSAIDRLAVAPLDAKIVAMGDKLSNMRAIWRDYKEKGDELWQIFHVTDKESHEWHYRGLAASLAELSDTYAFKEFSNLIDDVFGKEGKWSPVKINLDDYVESGGGFMADSYNHKNGRSMMKMYNPQLPMQVPQKELMCADALLKSGLNTPAPIRCITDGKRFGGEYVRITDKKSYSRLIADDPEHYDEHARKFARLCKKLHSTPADKTIFESITDYYHREFGEMTYYTDEQKAKFFKFIDSVPVCDTGIHGDLHIGNVITNGEKDWWIDLGDFCWGNPMFDLGMFYFMVYISPKFVQEDVFHMPAELFAKVWDSFLREYFGTEDDAKVAEIIEQIKPFGILKAAHLGGRTKMFPEMQAVVDEFLRN